MQLPAGKHCTTEIFHFSGLSPAHFQKKRGLTTPIGSVRYSHRRSYTPCAGAVQIKRGFFTSRASLTVFTPGFRTDVTSRLKPSPTKKRRPGRTHNPKSNVSSVENDFFGGFWLAKPFASKRSHGQSPYVPALFARLNVLPSSDASHELSFVNTRIFFPPTVMSRDAMNPASPGMKLSHVASRTLRPFASLERTSAFESFIHEDEFVSCLPTTCPFKRTSPPLSSENVSVAASTAALSGMSNDVRSVATAFCFMASGCQIHAAPSSAAPPSFSITSRRTMRAGCSRPTISGNLNGRVALRRDLGHARNSVSPGENVRRIFPFSTNGRSIGPFFSFHTSASSARSPSPGTTTISRACVPLVSDIT